MSRSALGAERSLPTPAWQTEESVGARPTPAGPSLKTGQRVRHPNFGEGIVIESRPEGGDEIITVAFEGQGLKRLLGSKSYT